MSTQKLFGTDGIRGTPGEYPLTDEMIHKVGSSLASFIPNTQHPTPNTQHLTPNTKIIIGKDTRLSGSHIEQKLAHSLSSSGVNVLLTGIITTPGVSFLVKELKADMGIMISASHNKPTDNGLKFFNRKGLKLSAIEEEEIERLIFSAEVYDRKPQQKKTVRIRTYKSASARYIRFLLSTVENIDLKGMRIALDCASGSGSLFAGKIFKRLKAKVCSINDSPCGENINVSGAMEPTFLKQLVIRTKADIGIALDGDGDRGILVDERGNVLDGDFILAIMANYLKKNKKLTKNTIVATVMSNYGLKVALEKIGAGIIDTFVGDKFVIDTLLKNNLNLGGEQSGHIIFLDYLPTPDGLLTALQLLQVMRDTGRTLSELAQCMSKFPQILVNVKVKEKRPFEELHSLNQRLQHCQKQLGGQGRILLRYSGTERLARVMVEGRDKDLINNIANSLAEEIKTELGAD